MRSFGHEIKNRITKLAPVLTSLLVGTAFALTTGAATASEVKKIVINHPVVEKVVVEVEKIRVENEKSDSGLDLRRINPFLFNFRAVDLFEEAFEEELEEELRELEQRFEKRDDRRGR